MLVSIRLQRLQQTQTQFLMETQEFTTTPCPIFFFFAEEAKKYCPSPSLSLEGIYLQTLKAVV